MAIDERDDVLGRARVRDDDRLRAYYDELGALDTGAFWTVANDIEPWEPTPASAPVHWRWAGLRENIVRAIDLVRPEDAGRRVIYLKNPKRTEVRAACGWLFSGLQVMKAGERASAHRHAASALRFIMEGSGAYTIVDGHRITLHERDFVITPGGTWHEHGILETGTNCIWQDGLDIPLTNCLEANFYEVHPDDFQSTNLPPDDSPNAWGAPGLLPSEPWEAGHSPLMRWSFDATYEALQRYAKATDGSPYDGVMMRFMNPKTGGHPMRTMGASMQLLQPAERTKAHRHTGNVIYQVAKGSGTSVVGGQRFDWAEKDIFCVPAWTFHEHASGAGDDAVLFSFNDFPVMDALGFWREEALAENGGHQPVVRSRSVTAK
ncbi:MAG: cupin domain-containing protein [Pseudomonadota bacterium]